MSVSASTPNHRMDQWQNVPPAPEYQSLRLTPPRTTGNTPFEDGYHALTFMDDVIIQTLQNLIFVTKDFTAGNMSQHLRHHPQILPLSGIRYRFNDTPRLRSFDSGIEIAIVNKIRNDLECILIRHLRETFLQR